MRTDHSMVSTTVEGQVATVLLDRPDARNAWSPQLETEFFDALDAASEDTRVRAIVVAGAGRWFCTGPDLELMTPESLASMERDPRGDAHPTTLPVPVIAAINGACVGIGLSMALMCDLRFVAPQASITAAFSRVGLIAEHGTAWLLQRVGSISVALDLLLRSRVIDGHDAQRLGLADVVAEDPLAAAQQYAADLAATASPTAMAAIKAQVYRDSTGDLAAAVATADRLVEEAARGDDFVGAVRAILGGTPHRHGPRRDLATDGVSR